MLRVSLAALALMHFPVASWTRAWSPWDSINKLEYIKIRWARNGV
jgi:hypothetical protein